MISIQMVIHNGFFSKFPILGEAIEQNSKYSTNTSKITSIRWEWRLSYIQRDRVRRKISVGIEEDKI